MSNRTKLHHETRAIGLSTYSVGYSTTPADDGDGYDYMVHYAGHIIARGWSAGRRSDAIDSARDSADEYLAKIPQSRT